MPQHLSTSPPLSTTHPQHHTTLPHTMPQPLSTSPPLSTTSPPQRITKLPQLITPQCQPTSLHHTTLPQFTSPPLWFTSPHTTQLLPPTTQHPTRSQSMPQSHTPMSMQLLMTTPRLLSMLVKPLMAQL